jgi:phosphoribosyl-ATP pyrophosphohydrolase
MAIYSGTLALGDAVAAPLRTGNLWPTVVSDEDGRTLGLAWSNRESLTSAVEERRGIYWSRSRNALWIKGESSGSTQRLLSVSLDCDRDAIQFVVRQEGAGFCHTGSRSCFGDHFTMAALERIVASRKTTSGDQSVTRRLMNEPGLLAAKLTEEAKELAQAGSRDEVIHEAADLLYFVIAALAKSGVSLSDVERELGRRRLRVSRRPMVAKP